MRVNRPSFSVYNHCVQDLFKMYLTVWLAPLPLRVNNLPLTPSLYRPQCIPHPSQPQVTTNTCNKRLQFITTILKLFLDYSTISINNVRLTLSLSHSAPLQRVDNHLHPFKQPQVTEAEHMQPPMISWNLQKCFQ